MRRLAVAVLASAVVCAAMAFAAPEYEGFPQTRGRGSGGNLSAGGNVGGCTQGNSSIECNMAILGTIDAGVARIGYLDAGLLQIQQPTGVECAVAIESAGTEAQYMCFNRLAGNSASGAYFSFNPASNTLNIVTPSVLNFGGWSMSSAGANVDIVGGIINFTTGAGFIAQASSARVDLAQGQDFATGGLVLRSVEDDANEVAVRIGASSAAPNALTKVISVCGASTAAASCGTELGYWNAAGLNNAVNSGTAGSGTGYTTNQTGTVAHKVHKITVTEAALGAAATSDEVIWTVPAKTRVLRMIADVTATFAGGAITDVDVTCGTTAGGNQYLVSFDVDTAIGTYGDVAAEIGAGLLSATVADVPSWSATTDVQCRFTCAGANCDEATTGSVTFYIEHLVYP